MKQGATKRGILFFFRGWDTADANDTDLISVGLPSFFLFSPIFFSTGSGQKLGFF